MKMKTLALLSLSLAVALGMPFASDEAKNPVLPKEDKNPVRGDVLPMQGHVVVEDPQPQVRLGEGELGVKVAPVVVEPDVKEKPEVRVETVPKEEQEVKSELWVEVQEKVEVKDEQGLKAKPEVRMQADVEVQQEGQELDGEPEVKEKETKVEPEVKVNTDVEVEPEVFPKSNEELEEEFEVKLDLLPEPEADPEFEESYINRAVKSESFDEPIMELEPLEEGDTEIPEEGEYPRASFQNQPVQEEEGFKEDYDYEEPIMELEPENEEEPFSYPEAAMEEGPALDLMDEPLMSLEGYFPEEEERMGMDASQQEDLSKAEQPEYFLMEEPGSEFGEERRLSQSQDSQATRRSYCPGVLLEGKCHRS